MIECYLQVASRNISDPCVASREGSKKDRKVCHKSSCLFRFLIVGTGSLYWFLILDYVLITWIFTIIWSKLQYEVLSWKICSLSGCADKIFFNNMQGEDKNACYGDVWVFNPKNGTIGSDIDQNKKSPSFSLENCLQPLETLNSNVKWAFSDQWVKKMAIFCFNQCYSQWYQF